MQSKQSSQSSSNDSEFRKLDKIKMRIDGYAKSISELAGNYTGPRVPKLYEYNYKSLITDGLIEDYFRRLLLLNHDNMPYLKVVELITVMLIKGYYDDAISKSLAYMAGLKLRARCGVAYFALKIMHAIMLMEEDEYDTGYYIVRIYRTFGLIGQHTNIDGIKSIATRIQAMIQSSEETAVRLLQIDEFQLMLQNHAINIPRQDPVLADTLSIVSSSSLSDFNDDIDGDVHDDSVDEQPIQVDPIPLPLPLQPLVPRVIEYAPEPTFDDIVVDLKSQGCDSETAEVVDDNSTDSQTERASVNVVTSSKVETESEALINSVKQSVVDRLLSPTNFGIRQYDEYVSWAVQSIGHTVPEWAHVTPAYVSSEYLRFTSTTHVETIFNNPDKMFFSTDIFLDDIIQFTLTTKAICFGFDTKISRQFNCLLTCDQRFYLAQKLGVDIAIINIQSKTALLTKCFRNGSAIIFVQYMTEGETPELIFEHVFIQNRNVTRDLFPFENIQSIEYDSRMYHETRSDMLASALMDQYYDYNTSKVSNFSVLAQKMKLNLNVPSPMPIKHSCENRDPAGNINFENHSLLMHNDFHANLDMRYNKLFGTDSLPSELTSPKLFSHISIHQNRDEYLCRLHTSFEYIDPLLLFRLTDNGLVPLVGMYISELPEQALRTLTTLCINTFNSISAQLAGVPPEVEIIDSNNLLELAKAFIDHNTKALMVPRFMLANSQAGPVTNNFLSHSIKCNKVLPLPQCTSDAIILPCGTIVDTNTAIVGQHTCTANIIQPKVFDLDYAISSMYYCHTCKTLNSSIYMMIQCH